MKHSTLITAALLAVALSACDRPTVVTPSATVVAVPGPAGATGTYSFVVRVAPALQRFAITPGTTVSPGVTQLQTGAWYDPDSPGRVGALDRHGNPNVLTLDKGTSKLAQGPSSQTALVEVERWTKPVPGITAFDQPAVVPA